LYAQKQRHIVETSSAGDRGDTRQRWGSGRLSSVGAVRLDWRWSYLSLYMHEPDGNRINSE